MSAISHPLCKDTAATEDTISINVMNYFHYKHTTASLLQSNVYIHIFLKWKEMQSNLNWIHSEAYNHNDRLETLLPYSNKCISTNDIKTYAFWVFLPWSSSALRSFVSLSTSIWLCIENKSILLKLQKKRFESFWSFGLVNIFNRGSNNIRLLDNLNSNSKTLLDSITLT